MLELSMITSRCGEIPTILFQHRKISFTFMQKA